MNLLEGWHTQFTSRDDCPWQGPRPMRSTTTARAPYSRRDEAQAFVDLVFDPNAAVVVLTGASGVGKTSMLNLDLRPALEDAGYQVLVCDEWARPNVNVSADQLIAEAVEAQLPPGVWLDEGRPTLVNQLDRLYPGTSIVILDQFEELMRFQPDLCQLVMDWIRDAATHSRVTVVVSLRIEYEHQLSGHTGLKLKPFQQTRFELKPLVVEDAVSVHHHDRPFRREPGLQHRTPRAPRALESIRCGRGDVRDRAAPPPSRALHALDDACAGRCCRIESAASDDLVRGGRPSRLAVLRARAGRVRQRRTASLPGSVPGGRGMARAEDSIATRAAELVASMSGHLSSGGYKISHDRDQLARRVLWRNADDDALRRRYGDPAAPASSRLAERVDLQLGHLRDDRRLRIGCSVTRSASLESQGRQ